MLEYSTQNMRPQQNIVGGILWNATKVWGNETCVYIFETC